MMPNVHLRIVKYVLEEADIYANVRVIEMTNGQSEDVNNKEISQTNTDESKRYVLDTSIYHILHPMVSEVSSKSHLFYRVVYFMEFP